ncbi:MAG: hypothetical protein ABSC16_07155 [Candidatus Dormibacteria bacterium]
MWWEIVVVVLIAGAALAGYRWLGGGFRGDLRRRRREGADPESLAPAARARHYRDD